MATRAAREKNSHLNEHHKKILADLMGEEANMHCADCRRKGKRVPPVAVFCHEKSLEKKKRELVCVNSSKLAQIHSLLSPSRIWCPL